MDEDVKLAVEELRKHLETTCKFLGEFIIGVGVTNTGAPNLIVYIRPTVSVPIGYVPTEFKGYEVIKRTVSKIRPA